ncbi:MAG: EAL domain-containing protein, partial [Nitrospinaceae bacterium]|nr:EAL domain-containing protein [Nitrospinaceae bacterium]
LLRWNSPELGFVPPDRFIAIAEETGLIVSIGEWVMRTACRDARTWRTDGSRSIRVAVNVSSRQVMGEQFLVTVTDVLNETGLQANCLGLEITEGLLMDDREDTIQLFEALAELGTTLALDDFGTGYSSLSYLKKFPFASLKIDRAFVRDVITNPEDATLCTAIAGMAKGMGFEVIGEGVESEAQLKFMRTIGCDQVQGYFFSKPLPVEKFIEFQKEWSPRPYSIA